MQPARPPVPRLRSQAISLLVQGGRLSQGTRDFLPASGGTEEFRASFLPRPCLKELSLEIINMPKGQLWRGAGFAPLKGLE